MGQGGRWAKALIQLDGVVTTTSQAQEIEHQYNRLLDYDKKTILFKPHPQRPTRGRSAGRSDQVI